MARLPDRLMARQAERSIRLACRLALRRVDLHVEGLEHLPRAGPAVIAARHYHHLYDGCALLTVIPRPVRIVVALDWLEHPLGQRLMTAACAAAEWPIVSRSDYPASPPNGSPGRARGASLLAAARASVDILRAGELLLVFPEGYPTIDPSYTPKRGDDAFLPFRSGFVRFALLAGRDGRTRVPIIPTGLKYQHGRRWRLTVRFGAPYWPSPDDDPARQARVVEARVRLLSGVVANDDADAAPTQGA